MSIMENERALFKRDISWLSFNYRVLMEAKDESLPLYERIKFLSIYSSNLEEFYRIRVSEHQKVINDTDLTDEERQNASRILCDINREVERQLVEFDRFFQEDIVNELRRHNIVLSAKGCLEPFHSEYVRTYFREEIFPFLEPVPLSKELIRSFIRDNRLYIVVRAHRRSQPDAAPIYFVMKVPYKKVPRFVELPQLDGLFYLMFVEDVIKHNLDYIFPGFDIESAYNIRVSRDADFMIPTETPQTLVDEIRRNVRKRKIGTANRFVYESSMPADFLEYLADSFNVSLSKCIPEGHHLNLEDLNKMPNPVGAALTEELPPPLRIEGLDSSASVFRFVAGRDTLVHLPYHSFGYLIRFLNEAAFDPEVEEIKLTQYRVAENSDVISTLIRAAQNGKKVTVFVELKARFDEENNFDASQRMRKAGISIIYSLPGLKVHAKMALVIGHAGQDGQRKSYACLSTGNFNEKTARIYSDILIFTASSDLISEMTVLFDMLEYGIHEYDFKHIIVTRFNMIDRVREKINREIEISRKGGYARIVLKMNGLQDPEMINMLYDASQAGVKVELIVRGICCLVPDRPYSSNITVTRIVDSYLEHARVWYFHADGLDEVYITSADWMKRNLSRRIETAFPVYDSALKEYIIKTLNIQLSDNVKACSLDGNLTNVYKTTGRFEHPVRSQRRIYELLRDE